ncbi:MAG TPA: hypothetical protein DDZ96_00145 [Porphyromonadaceae bacterium]|jgi:carbonic anhydrase|uniref:hypothetical protein n=1 Tax=Limibacterium fermenti TaxID=3229863 RepID=UPI000E82B0A3|nr:hypothetical protein [Porphyromonadaceae bacterium]HBK33142.1 hypothetical protein [Porphyromonadaceae bacterium]HBL32213.1 hypothetical protein [Porphyromonadaceae bacterium]HBX21718.1 hypothetical protein [Porphyromonadaceae bacterium]HBX46624.1 hypothetical protein [Porphyromonadaceae bacterium]
MKKQTIITLSLVALLSCNTAQKSKQTIESSPADTVALVGADKDEHGCKGSAGFTWSQLKQDCVRLFEAGERFNPINVKEGEAVQSAFVLWNDNRSKAELFLPENENSLILDKTSDTTYEYENYKLDAVKKIVSKDNVHLYRAEK